MNFTDTWRLEVQEVIEDSIIVDGNDRIDDCNVIGFCSCRSFNDSETCIDINCINFAMQTECSQKCNPNCQNNRFRSKKYAKIDVAAVPNKGYGLFILEDIKANSFIAEYVGEIISDQELYSRMRKTATDKHLYVMEIKKGTFLDASRKGSISRFINHSCEPNCEIALWTVGNRIRAGIFTLDDIEGIFKSQKLLSRACFSKLYIMFFFQSQYGVNFRLQMVKTGGSSSYKMLLWYRFVQRLQITYNH